MLEVSGTLAPFAGPTDALVRTVVTSEATKGLPDAFPMKAPCFPCAFTPLQILGRES